MSLHVLAAVIWVGGMFFAYMVLRPTTASLLSPPQRLALWSGVFSGFFPWVWICVITLLLSGYWMMLVFQLTAMHVHVMHGLGLVMMLLFIYVFFVPYKALKQSLFSIHL